jgi:arylformamidase
MGVHTGTHVDSPHHFLNNHQTIEQLDLNLLTGPAWVVQIPEHVRLVDAQTLDEASVPSGTKRLLLRTRNSQLWSSDPLEFTQDFVGVSDLGAQWLVGHGIRLIGIDYLSIAPWKQGTPTHTTLLTSGVIILEGVNLSHVQPGAYYLYCLPLNLLGSDGAPARAILVQ